MSLYPSRASSSRPISGTDRSAEYLRIVDHLYAQGILVAQWRQPFGGDDDGVEPLVKACLSTDHAVRVVARLALG